MSTPNAPLRLLRSVGDCNTRGAGELSAKDSFPARFLKLLQQSGESWELDNLGAAMNTSREGIARMRDCERPADLLLVNFGLVDAWVTAIPWVYVPYYPDSRWRKWSRKTLKVVKRRLRSPWIRRIVGQGTVVSRNEYRKNIRTIIEIERERNSDVEVILWSTVMTRSSPARNTLLTEYNQVLKDLSCELGTLFFDSAASVQELSHAETYLDEVHLSATAAEYLSDRLYRLRMSTQGTARAA